MKKICLTMLCLIAAAVLQAAAPEYKVTMFPIMFEKNNFSVCENYPGQLEIFFRGNQNKYQKSQAKMVLDLPEFITLTGVCEWNKLPRDGKVQRVPAVIKKSAVKRGKLNYNRYHVTFDPYFTRFINHGWYRTFMVFEAREKSAGKTGKAYWSFEAAGDKLTEQSFDIRILPPVQPVTKSCRNFILQLYYSPLRLLPFPGAIRKEQRFWDCLAENRHYHSRFASDVESDKKLFPGYLTVMTTSQLATSYDKYLTRLRDEFFASVPPNIDAGGKKLSHPDAVAILGKYAPVYEKYLRNFLRHVQKNYPHITSISDDFEPHPWGFGIDGRTRFAKEMKLAKVPSREEILAKYQNQWFKFMVKVHNELLYFRLRIFKEEAPKMTYRLVSDNLHAAPPHLALWCGVDVALADKGIDLHNHMPYYAGTRYFDDMVYCMKFFTKPYLPLIDPGERLERFYRQYNAPKITQNIVATAALGCIGIGFWPDIVFPGEYYHAVRAGFEMVSQGEEFYFGGKRCDDEFEIVARNAVSTRLSDGKVITYPNFVPFIRSTAHKRNGKYLLTLFNYHEKQPLILEIRQKRPVKGSPFPMLVRIEPQGCALAGTDFIQEQKALREAVKNYSGQGKIFKTLNRKGKKIFWTADAAMRPVLRMEDGNAVASIDSSNNCELVSFITKEGAELFGGGFAGRVIFSDRLQLPLKFEMEDYKFTKEGFPCFTAVSTVVPYDGASPIPNPLYKMVVRRKIELRNGKVLMTLSFHNPTEKAMELDLRLNSFPRSLGERLKVSECVVNGKYNASSKDVLLMKGKGWDGKTVTARAADEYLQDILYFTPDSRIKGFFTWKDTNFNRRTVEFIVKDKLLPGKTLSFSYTISDKAPVEK